VRQKQRDRYVRTVSLLMILIGAPDVYFAHVVDLAPIGVDPDAGVGTSVTSHLPHAGSVSFAVWAGLLSANGE